MARVLALDIWMNGVAVGRWERPPNAADRLTYDADWMASPAGRPLSLSLPFSLGAGQSNDSHRVLRGDAVAAYFENLIPDNERILQRLRDRYSARSTAPFDLLAAIGRDCVGAIQLVPADSAPGDMRRIEARPLDEAGVADVLRHTTMARLPGQRPDDDAFRLSIAGAQEKTALLRHDGKWCIPHGATPSTHIFKLPLGLIGNVQADMRQSVELEWLCMELVREFGLPVAKVEIGRFEDQKALIVERFDRAKASDGDYWLRIPQEDFCQASGPIASTRATAARASLPSCRSCAAPRTPPWLAPISSARNCCSGCSPLPMVMPRTSASPCWPAGATGRRRCTTSCRPTRCRGAVRTGWIHARPDWRWR